MINYGIKSKMDQLVQIPCSTGNVNIDIQISKFLTFLVQILSQKLKIETGICFQFELCMYVMFEIWYKFKHGLSYPCDSTFPFIGLT